MRYPTRRLERLFVLRLWREEGASPGTVRGSAEDVEGGQRVVFSELRDLERFLLRVLHRAGTASRER